MILLNTIKKELDALGAKPKKSLGQNFLVNEGVYKKMVAALEIERGDTIIEIGPGLGTLTGYLADSGAEIVAIEKDGIMAAYLKNKFRNNKNATITEGDILKFNPTPYTLNAKRFKVVGNIPYYITSHLLRTIFEKWPKPEIVVLMLQKEVARRIVAKPPDMSLLAVSVQYYARPEIISYVSAGSFYPPPKVDSAIIKLTPFEKAANGKEADKFFKIVRAGFVARRKQLAGNLARGLKIERKIIEDKFSAIGLKPGVRAENLTLEQWQKIAQTL